MMQINTIILAAAAAALAAPAAGQSYTTGDRPVVVERNAEGKATKVLVEGVVYPVCMSEKQDHCIQPRAVGLGWGDVPLGYWPGEPASPQSSGARS